ncbi:hypothetical protein [Chryseobacterium populi]|uniref:Uncharacterized protein n=1 Tax=Chryseobacterium populi TaxID=1144316 RepID=J2JW43_9FLAO|nr:hypothetical protein [Chryseobacterium populi]EJL72045.1 hypothetical protein PMI13_02036 [Chryseobacterium populi]
MEKLTREVRILKIYAVSLTAVCILFFFFAFKHQNSHQRFEEIDVERINVIEKDGTLKMVISNKKRQHPGMVNNKEFKPREREAGLIFFNELGDECGGLVYGADKDGSGMVYSVDQKNTDQIMQLQYMEGGSDKKNRTYGLKLWDRPDDFPLEDIIKFEDSLKKLNDPAASKKAYGKLRKEGKLTTERFFAGKTGDGDVGLFLKDSNGRIRLKIYVDKNNQTHIDKLDENGQIVK